MVWSRSAYWSGQLFPFPGDLPNPGIEPRSPALQPDSLTAEPQGKPKSTGVGRLSLLQGIFLTQESNRSLLNFRRIFYQLSYQGSPDMLSYVTVEIAILTLWFSTKTRWTRKFVYCSRSNYELWWQTAEARVWSTKSIFSLLIGAGVEARCHERICGLGRWG